MVLPARKRRILHEIENAMQGSAPALRLLSAYLSGHGSMINGNALS